MSANRYCPSCSWPIPLLPIRVGPVSFCSTECRDRYVSARKAVGA
jgi:predicted nucleic acid-binding Zn ribbon protein